MQYLNIMTELEINKLATMLSSDDTEIREIALNILINQYDLDFDMWESLDEGPGLTYSFQKRGSYSHICNTLMFLKLRVRDIHNKRSIYSYIRIIKLIIEYNERKQNK